MVEIDLRLLYRSTVYRCDSFAPRKSNHILHNILYSFVLYVFDEFFILYIDIIFIIYSLLNVIYFFH